MLESILSKQFIEFMNTNAILPPIQSEFRTGHINTTALMKVANDIVPAIHSTHVLTVGSI